MEPSILRTEDKKSSGKAASGKAARDKVLAAIAKARSLCDGAVDRCLLAEANVKWAELLDDPARDAPQGNDELLTVQKLLRQARALPRPLVRNSTKWEGAKKQLENVEIRLQGLPAPGDRIIAFPES